MESAQQVEVAATHHPSLPPQQGQFYDLVFCSLGAAVVLSLFRSGPTNVVLVLLTSAFLLCNPWLRTLLELPPADQPSSRFDPARYLVFSRDSDHSSEDHVSQGPLLRDSHNAAMNEKKLSLASMPIPLQDSIRHITRLVVRDFVRYWYDPITFAHPGFIQAADESISHFTTSIFFRLRASKSVDVASELLLTSQSVVLAALRRKRIQAQSGVGMMGSPTSKPADSDFTWSTSTARIESLRKAVRKLLARNLSTSERQSPVVVSLMTEILTKQCWEVVQYISDPDFINMQIVKWGEPASETSLEGETITPKELEELKRVQGADLSRPSSQVRDSSTEFSRQHRQSFSDQWEQGEVSAGKLDPSDFTGAPEGTTTSSWPPNPTTEATGLNPFSAIGGFIADAAERTVDVVGGAVDSVGTTLMGDEISQPPPQLPERRQTSTHQHDQDLSRPVLPLRPVRSDIPKDIQEPPLPESPRQSLRSVAPGGGSDGGYTIPDTSDTPATPAKSGSLMPSLEDVLSGRDASVYDAFEHFLEDPSNPHYGRGEGDTLLRLHAQLNTLSSIAEFASLDEQTLRGDTTSILNQSIRRLPRDLPKNHDGSQPINVHVMILRTLDKLQQVPDMKTIKPLEAALLGRLEQLYSAFKVSTAGSRPALSGSSMFAPQQADSPQQVRPPLPARKNDQLSRQTSVSSTTSRSLAYEPRRKNTNSSTNNGISTPPPQVPSRPPSVPPRPRVGSALSNNSSPERRFADPMTPIPRNSSEMGSVNAPYSASRSSQDGELNVLEVLVTDVSINADRLGNLDPRSLEVMLAVEGLASSGDGFVLLRRWSEFEALDAELQRMPRSSIPIPHLPSPRGKSSAEFCPKIEAYIRALLTPPEAISIPSVQRFMDKTRAGAPAETLRAKGGPAAFFGGIGKNLFSGVGAVGKTARTGLGLTSGPMAQQALPTGSGVAPTGSLAVQPGSGAIERGKFIGDLFPRATPLSSSEARMGARTSSPYLESTSSDTSGFPSRTGSPVFGASAPAELSAKDLDQILSAVFAVADEAFNLQGGWTLRRGMLRVLEQVVRTTYSGSLVATLNSAASGLNTDNFADWIDALRTSYWPNNDQWSAGRTTTRNPQDKEKTHEKAREILVSYAPVQAGYILGPGGRLACVNALVAIHDTVVDPVTASDLGLTMTLKALEMAAR